MRLKRSAFICCAILIILAGCAREDKPTINKAVWSSRDPFNIPYKKRINEFREGNRIVNPSFERGRFFNDNLGTFEVNGWREIGEDIEWVNITKPEYDSSEVKSGIHSIKIKRKRVSEVEERGVGIMSDYIKVFPGNYKLNYHIRLENICSNKERLGSRLMDAINIRILYYDKNKIRIDGNARIPGKGKMFDNEFKSVPFSGFWTIDSLGWIKSRGISHKYPFSDGDIPDNTRYVRIFFGLKGTGTLWIDDVSFEFSKENFTLLEKAQFWTDTIFRPADLLIPEPKFISSKTKLTYYDAKNSSRKPLIVVPQNADALTIRTARMVRNKLKGKISGLLSGEQLSIPIVRQVHEQSIQNRSLVFSIGKNFITNRYYDHLPFQKIEGKKQGYFIHRLNDTTNIIALSGNTSTGNFYAARTLLQLLDKEKMIYHHANIIDFPDFNHRGIIYNWNKNESQENLEFLANNRINGVYVNGNKKNTIQIQQGLEKVSYDSGKGILYQPGFSVNPLKYNKQKNPNYFSVPESRKNIRNLLRICRKNSINNLLIRLDNTFKQKDSCSCLFALDTYNQEINRHSILDFHSEFIKDVYNQIGNESRLAFLLPWHNNNCIIRSHGAGEVFLDELSGKIGDETSFVWTGPVDQAFIIDETETRYIQKRYGEKPVFLTSSINPISKDTFLNHYPGKARMASIFNHFNLHLPDSFHLLTAGRFIADLNLESSLHKIGLMTLSDYLWNSSEFKPVQTLMKVLIAKYGKDTAFELIRLNEAYYGLYEMYGKIKTEENKRKFLRSAESFKNRFSRIMKNLQEELENSSILSELEGLQTEADSLFTNIQTQW
jgi:hypothetical protein